MDDVHGYFNAVIKEHLQGIHQQAPKLTNSTVNLSHISKLTTYMKELSENFTPDDVSPWNRVNFFQPAGHIGDQTSLVGRITNNYVIVNH